jgi:hypothetical protein
MTELDFKNVKEAPVVYFNATSVKIFANDLFLNFGFIDPEEVCAKINQSESDTDIKTLVLETKTSARLVCNRAMTKQIIIQLLNELDWEDAVDLAKEVLQQGLDQLASKQ